MRRHLHSKTGGLYNRTFILLLSAGSSQPKRIWLRLRRDSRLYNQYALRTECLKKQNRIVYALHGQQA